MTINQLYSNKHADDLVHVIRQNNADIVGIQELSPGLAQAIDEQLRDLYPYQWMLPGDHDKGLGLLSKVPFDNQQLSDGFNCQQAVIRFQGQPITLINVHLTAPDIGVRRQETSRVPWLYAFDESQRNAEWSQVFQAIDRSNGSLVVLGDFNTNDHEPPYKAMAARMQDTFDQAEWGFGFTFPSNAGRGSASSPIPLIRIDYIWVRDGIVPSAAHVDCNSGGSDHCLLVADMLLQDEAAAERGWLPW